MSTHAGQLPVLAWTKLQPLVRRGMIPRDAVIGFLRERGPQRLTLIRAPAGWGTTTLLAQWYAVECEARSFGWLALDREDNDPIRFWTYVAAALRGVDAEPGDEALALLWVPGIPPVADVLPVLVNGLAAARCPVVLVLDDYHVIANPDIDEGLAFLVEHLPSTTEIVVATRAEPALPSARLRVRGQLTEIGPAQLRFGPADAAVLLNELHGLDLDPDAVSRLCARTEGWAAGLYLAALSLRDRADPAGFVGDVADYDGLVVDYLSAEVLAGQPEPVRAFLCRTSVLDRMCPALCDAVTGTAGSAAVLERLERSNLFLVPLDSRREWYRYHHLFGELLGRELARTEPDLVAELHRRAARWFLAVGEVTGSVRHLVAAGDHTEAAEVVARHWMLFAQANLDQTVAGWLEVLTIDVVGADTRLCLAAAFTALSMNRHTETARWISAAERAEPAGPFHDGLSSVAGGVAMARATLSVGIGDLPRMLDQACRAAALEPATSPWRAVAVLSHGVALRWLGRGTEAEKSLTSAVRAALASGQMAVPAVYAMGQLAALAADRLDWPVAAELADEALRAADGHGLAEHLVCGIAHLVRGRVAEQAGEHAVALPHVLRGIELAARGASPLDRAWGDLVLARVRHGLGDRVGAQAAFALARVGLASCPEPGVVLTELLAATRRWIQGAGRVPRSTEGAALTERELAVLRLLPGPSSQREIAAELHLSLNTVKTHAAGIFRKLGVSGRAAAVAHARQRGLL